MSKIIAAGLLVIAAFVAGIAIGYYELPPVAWLRAVKQALRIELPLSRPVSPRADRGVQANRPRSATETVMLGDSLTARGDWNRLIPTARLRNDGIDGDTSLGVLNRLHAITGDRPARVFLMIGINDLMREEPVAQVAERIQLIALTLRANGIAPIVQSVLHVSAREAPINRNVNALNSLLRDWCAAQGITFVDLAGRLAADNALPAAYSADGLHLNERAYAVWADVIRPYMPPNEDKAPE